MTFKHVKFQDSPTMRALEKVAHEKGLIKAEPIQKQAAAKQEDFTPGTNLMENIFKLCAGMRAKGLEKEAAEVELNYLNYKRAQTLYETSKEKGEDVIQFAHPKGSHKLEGVEGDEATFEDILDRHSKMLQVVEKKPTGKLSSATQILNAVKTVLGQDQNKDQLLGEVQSFLGQIKDKVSRAMDLAEPEVRMSLHFWRADLEAKTQDPDAVKLDNLHKLKGMISQLSWRLKPGAVFGISEDTWSHVYRLLNDAIGLVDSAARARNNYNNIVGQEEQNVGKPTPAPAADEVATKFSRAISEFNSLSGLISTNDPKYAEKLQQTKTWLSTKAQELNGKLNQYNAEPDKSVVSKDYLVILNRYTTALEQVKKQWL